jgi:Na+-transporting methylmalonyl-CoA/oxaloacetate decarboxylase gamma subunit
MNSYDFLFWGYFVVFAGLAVYFAVLMRRLAAVTRRVDVLESSAKPKAPPSAT